jgi:Na+-transporting methylmalonyl-CoA/oxaloacetate decarboxylase gamma subunit
VTENLTLALLITLIGMGLVFAALILLWLLMLALTRLTAGPAAAPEADGAADRKRQAAAAAVAVVLADQALSAVRPFPMPPTALISAWQLGMRTRQMHQKGGQR